jgi:hypothetical protein
MDIGFWIDFSIGGELQPRAPARPAGGVEDAPMIGLDNFDNELDDAGRGEKLAALLPEQQAGRTEKDRKG